VQDEAFELGMRWSKLYDQGSPSQALIENMMESYALVNVVHNDFRNPEAIFAPFYRAAEGQNALSNGHSNGIPIKGLTNGH
jgi:methylenetetrahydrofolate reductase (NADPH)